jgi:hypothetical protein
MKQEISLLHLKILGWLNWHFPNVHRCKIRISHVYALHVYLLKCRGGKGGFFGGGGGREGREEGEGRGLR